MAKLDLQEEGEKIAWEGGLSEYIYGYGGRSKDPEISQLMDQVALHLEKIEQLYEKHGVSLEEL